MDAITTGGLAMPKLGLGTWQMRGSACTRAVQDALALGYRHIDTAQMYGNEAAVGAALAESGVARAALHLTSKVWPDNLAPAALRRALETSLRDLRTPYVDLYLIHWPTPTMDLAPALETLVRAREDGLARAIGVSNFPVALMRRAVEELGAPIACNQVEYHVLLDQSRVLDYARRHGIAVTAYAPLARGRLEQEPELRRIARRHGASVAQVALKWLLDQDGVAAIPKASRRENQQANLEALQLPLDDADRAAIAALPKQVRIVQPGWAMDWD
jgi:2,5-diketo-D-gluconate reductase B